MPSKKTTKTNSFSKVDWKNVTDDIIHKYPISRLSIEDVKKIVKLRTLKKSKKQEAFSLDDLQTLELIKKVGGCESKNLTELVENILKRAKVKTKIKAPKKDELIQWGICFLLNSGFSIDVEEEYDGDVAPAQTPIIHYFNDDDYGNEKAITMAGHIVSYSYESEKRLATNNEIDLFFSGIKTFNAFNDFKRILFKTGLIKDDAGTTMTR